MYYIGIAVMVLGLVGLIFCAKKQRVNPAMQSVAVVFALIMFSGLGMALHDQMSGDVQSEIENEQLFLYSRSAAAGKCLKADNAGKKVLFVTSPGWDKEESRKEQVLKQVEAFKAAYGSNDIVIDSIAVPANFEEEGSAIEDVMSVKDFTALLEKHAGVQVVVSDIGLPEKGDRIFSKKDAPVVFLLSSGNLGGKTLKKMFKDKKLAGMIGYKSKADYDAKADEDDLLKSFEIRYILIDQNNYTTQNLD